VRAELADFKLVKDALGGTVNDVVLTVVSGALARWLRDRGVRTEGLELRALVPVSIRPKEARGQLGNQLTVMRGPLPVYIRDPVARLRHVRDAMNGLKESKQALGAEALTAVNNLAPPTVLAQASRLNFSTRLFNLIVTNVPGPQFPLYLLGRELKELFPIAFLPKDHALAIAIMSYNGGIDFGLLGDYDALPDIGEIAEGVAESLAELKAAARRALGEAEPAAELPDVAEDADGAAPAKRATTKRAPARKPAPTNGNGDRASSLLPSGPSARAKRGAAASMRAKRQPPGGRS
jgi:WS/DGAT/MGAT family acyltransferase